MTGTRKKTVNEAKRKKAHYGAETPTPLLDLYLKLLNNDRTVTKSERKRKLKKAGKMKSEEAVRDELLKNAIRDRLDRMLNPKNPLKITNSDIRSLKIPGNRFYTGFANGTPLKAAKQALLDSGWIADADSAATSATTTTKKGKRRPAAPTIEKMVIFLEANLSEVSPMSANFVMEEIVMGFSGDAITKVTCGLGDNPELEYGEWNVLLLFSADEV